PLVRAQLDGRDAGWFVLDTGASALAISEPAAAALALPELGRRFVRTSDGVAGAVAARVPGPSGPRDAWFTLDTGSSAAVTLSAGAAHAIEVRRRGRVALRGVSGSVGARAGELPWIELAGHRVEDVAVVIARAGAGATGDPTPEPHVAGSLGMALLKDFTLTLDYQARRVQLRRRARALRAPRSPARARD
ncbi:MAG TPA: retropepsin-like aspartic protease, partial [Kofleriaceae bacterium]|nr:retropepsin-like aspartic protease [Kofleriaceae bacterium]